MQSDTSEEALAKRRALLGAYEALKRCGQRITVHHIMALVQARGITQNEVRAFVQKIDPALRRGADKEEDDATTPQ